MKEIRWINDGSEGEKLWGNLGGYVELKVER